MKNQSFNALSLRQKKKGIMRLFFILIIGLTCFSCQKIKGESLEGTYCCLQVSSYWDMYTPPSYSTSSYEIEVIHKGDEIRIGNFNMLTKEIMHEKKYVFGDQSYYTSFQFKDKMLFIEKNNSGLGGGGSSQSTCHKLE